MRNKLIYCMIILSLLFSLVAWGCGAPKGEATVKHDLRMATSPPPSMYYGAAVIATATMDRYSSGNISVACYGLPGGTPAHYERLRDGEVEMILSNAVSDYQVYHGVDPYLGEKALPDLRILFYFGPSPLHIVVRADSGITSMAGLAGQKFGAGFLGTMSADMTVAIVDKTLGIKPEWVERSLADLITDVKDRRIVGVSKLSTMLGVESSIQELMATTPMSLLGFTPEQEATIKAKYPYVSWHTIPAGTYPGQTEDKRVVGFPVGMAVGKDMPEEVGYELFRALHMHWKDCVDVFPVWKGLDIGKFALETLQGTGTPLHAGVVRYLREKGYKVEADRVPPEMK